MRKRFVLLMSGGISPLAATITANLSSPTTTESASVTISWPYAVIGFTVDDITVGGGGTLSNFSGSGQTYTVEWALSVGENTLDIAAGVCEDDKGNPNLASSQFVMDYGVRVRYVTTTGNDSTGDGTLAKPYATIGKAINTAQNGDLIEVADGNYAENQGGSGAYGNWNKTLTSYAVVKAQRGAAGVVNVYGASHAVINIFITSDYFKFHYLRFSHRTTGMDASCNLFNLNTNLQFISCVFSWVAGSSHALVIGTGSGTTTDITFSKCTLTDGGTFTSGFYLANIINTNAGSIRNITFSDCDFLGGAYGLWAYASGNGLTNGIAGLLIDGCRFTNAGRGSIVIGTDTNAVVTSYISVTVQNTTIAQSVGGHGLLMGAGSYNCVVDNVTVTSAYDIGIVAKVSDGHEIKNCHVVSGTTCSLMARGATNVNYHHNTLTGAPSVALFRLEQCVGTKAQNITCVDNTMTASGAGKCLSWLGDDDDAGGGVCDRNTYHFVTGSLGQVRSTSNIATLAALQAAWSGYGDGSNDANSTVV